jgi:KipI family sensor histidine kinase inhibitor
MVETPGHPVTFRAASDRSLLIRLGESINLETHRRVLKLLRTIEARPVDGIIDLHPAYASILVVFDPVRQDHARLQVLLRGRLAESERIELPQPRRVEIPVCYGGEYGPDLDAVARLHQITPERVAELHSSPVYSVYFLGFAPGFAYLGGLPDEIATPRLDTPRARVPAGSVGIAGTQTGIYPFATPGGWRLIGRTPLRMFDPGRGPRMSLLEMGDQVRFVPIGADRFAAMDASQQ